MEKQKKMLVLAILMVFISLVVLLPRIVNADDDDGVFEKVELVATSTKSWEDAAQKAVMAAGKSLKDLRVAEITKLDMKVEGGKITAYRARVSLSFKYESGD